MSSPLHIVSQKAELSRPVRVEDLGLQTFTTEIDPTAEELTALAQRLKVEKLDALSAQVSLKLLPTGDVVMKAVFKAHVTQTCVVTLKPVTNDISSEFTITYSHISADESDLEEETFADLEDTIEPPEPIVDGKIDLGEAVAEHLALEIDPFPRVKGATFDGYSTGSDAKDTASFEKKNPFAVLSKLKETPKSSE